MTKSDRYANNDFAKHIKTIYMSMFFFFCSRLNEECKKYGEGNEM